MNPFLAIGPGIVIAATGLGAGDLIAASVAGARYGATLLWVVAIGALLKFVLNENLARWQLATSSTVIEALIDKLPKIWSVYFLIYLLVWSFVVAAALMAACGLAVHALFPEVSVKVAGIAQSVIAAVLVLAGRYQTIEWIMKVCIALMFVVVMICAVLVAPEVGDITKGLFFPVIPKGSTWFLLGVLGGIGGSVTLLSYGYWMREKGWRGTVAMKQMRIDLVVAYVLTGLFGIAIMIIASSVPVEAVSGNQMVLSVATQLEASVGPVGKWSFLIGFWGAVFSSMLGVWQGVPYLFADFMGRFNKSALHKPVTTTSTFYRIYLLYLCTVPMLMLWLNKPVWLILLYSVTGAAFMPLLAGLLLYINNRPGWIGNQRNSLVSNFLLTTGMVIFFSILVHKIIAVAQDGAV